MTSYPRSDHFNGTHFFNPGGAKERGFLAGFKLISTMRRQKWPDFAANSPALELNRQLGADNVAVTFVNHSTLLVQTRKYNFLTDPVWSERVSPVAWAGPRRHRPPGIPFEELPRIDFVLISHNHYDHLDLATVRRLNGRWQPRFLVPLGNKKFLEANGIANVREMDWWQACEPLAGVKVAFAPAVHFSGRTPFDRNKTLWGSYLILFGGHTLYYGADTAYSPHFKTIRERFGPPELAFLPIGAYEPRWFMGAVHVNPEEAVQAHLDLAAKRSIGIHFGTFQLTEEGIDQPVKDLAAALEKRNVPKNEFMVLGEGRTEVFALPSSQ